MNTPRLGFSLFLLVFSVFLVFSGCNGGDSGPTPTASPGLEVMPTPTGSPSPTPTASPGPTPTPTATPTPTPTATATPTPSPSPSPTPSPTPTASPSPEVHNLTRNRFYTTIQAAIDDAREGDEIVVPPGVYRENIDFKGKDITVRSSDPQNPAVTAETIIDGGDEGSVVTFQSGETRQAILQGFTIRRGDGTMQYWPHAVLAFGGGIYIKDSSPNITFNVIRDNAVNHCGGGIYITGVSSPRIVRNTIEDNYAMIMGGGIFVDGSASPLIQQNTIKDNEAASLPAEYPFPPHGYGGGICVGMNASVRNIAGVAWPRQNCPPAGTESGGTYTYQNNTFSGNTHRGGRTDEGCHVYFASSP